MSIFISGGYSVGVPPLPLPNREVKPVRADGTAYSGRVGRRHFSERFFKILKNLFFYLILLSRTFHPGENATYVIAANYKGNDRGI